MCVQYANKRAHDRAISDFNKAIEINKNNSGAYAFRGILSKDKGQYDGALSDLNKSLEIDPKNAYAYDDLRAILLELDNKESSCVNFQKAVIWDYVVTCNGLKKRDIVNKICKQNLGKNWLVSKYTSTNTDLINCIN